MWEHIHWLHGGYFVFHIQQLQIACLSCRVTAHIHNAFRLCIQYHVHHIFVHTSARRVCDYYVWTAVLFDEFVGQYVFHIASKEQRIVDAVDSRVHFCVLNSFRHIFYTNHLSSLSAHEVCNRTRTSI